MIDSNGCCPKCGVYHGGGFGSWCSCKWTEEEIKARNPRPIEIINIEDKKDIDKNITITKEEYNKLKFFYKLFHK